MDYLDKFKLVNKNVFVVGGMGLIGKEIVKSLKDVGANVIVIDLIVGDDENLNYEKWDITDLENTNVFLTKLIKKYNSIDVWINTSYPRTDDWGDKVEDLKLESWRKNIDMHLNSYSWVSREVALVMKEQGGGNIINLGSIYGVVSPDFTIYDEDSTSPMAYSAIKGGIINLTRYLAAYFGKYNIRVNTVCSGGIFDFQDEEFVKKYEDKVPLKRMGMSSDIASATLFLASEASSYITGQSLMVDGGWTIV